MTTDHFCRRRHRSRHSGVILFIALISLLIVMAILGQMLRTSLQAQRQLHPERDLRQTELLLQAGADRAAYRLANQADYRGETWRLPAASIVGAGDGEVTIAASRDSDQQPWHVHVIAEYPHGGVSTIRRSRTFLVPTQISQSPQSQE
jgi:hypothetical protein